MTEEVFDAIGHLFCGDCKFWGCGNDYCQKRIDHKNVRFAIPWFKSYDAHQHSGCICSDFEPASFCVFTCSAWTGFWDYWEWYSKIWIPYGNTDILTYFTMGEDTSVRYGVPLMDFVNGTMYDGSRLKAVEKMYYKKHRHKDRTKFPYELIREKIEGVGIKSGKPQTKTQ